MGAPWERQRDDDGKLEPWLWFDRFERFYRDQTEKRSVLEAANRWRDEKGTERQTTVPGAWSRIVSRWHWKERAEAWDVEQRRLRIQEKEREREEAHKRHVQLARGLQSVGGKRLRQLQDDVEALSPGEARQYVKEGIGLERQAMGLPEYLIEVAALTDEQLLARYHAKLGELAGVGSPGGGDEGPGPEAAGAAEEAQPSG